VKFSKLENAYEKRNLLLFLCFSFCVCLVAIDNVQLGQFLTKFATLSDFYRLLSSNLAEKTFFVRTVRFLMDQRFSIRTCLRFFLEVVSMKEYFILFVSIILLVSISFAQSMKRMKQVLITYWITNILQYLIAAPFIVMSMQTISTDSVIANMNAIGIVFSVISYIHIGIFLLSFFIVYRGFRESE
jgi:hypothetical protein